MDIYGNHYVSEQFANKELVAYKGKDKHNHHTWMWKCLTCSFVYGPSVVNHMNRSTRCLNCMNGSTSPRWLGYKELTGTWLSSYKLGATKRNISWNVTPQYLWQIWEEQDSKCIYTKLFLKHGIDASLDRIDNTLGYEVGNVQWVHTDINRMKSDFTEQHFIYLCNLIQM